jgi:hypothetical protein
MHIVLSQEADKTNRMNIRDSFQRWLLSGGDGDEDNKSVALAFVQNSIKELDLLEYSNHDQETVERISNWLLMTIDIAAMAKTAQEGCIVNLWAKGLLDQILEVGHNAFVRPYIPKNKVITSLRFISIFCDLLQEREDKEDHFLRRFFQRLEPIVPRIFHFILQQLQGGFQEQADERDDKRIV